MNCKECQFEDREHSFECSKYKEKEAPICNTEHSVKRNLFGHQVEVFVKEKLWRYGYRVKQVRSKFDLIVDGKYRVEVKSASPKVSKINGNITWNVMMPYQHENYDVLAVVLSHPISKATILFYPKDIAKKMIGKKYSLVFSEKRHDLINMAYISPFDIFGYPKWGVH